MKCEPLRNKKDKYKNYNSGEHSDWAIGHDNGIEEGYEIAMKDVKSAVEGCLNELISADSDERVYLANTFRKWFKDVIEK